METSVASLAHRAVRVLATVACLAALGGCATSTMRYEPNAVGPLQTVRYTQGVGTLTEVRPEQELFIYPTFKTQGAERPTFTIGYANNTAAAVDFSAARIKAFFRGREVPVYTYEDRIDEIRTDKRAKQVALAILGGLAAAGAAYGASHHTYTGTHKGVYRAPGGTSTYNGYSRIRVYDPASGILAGAAVGGATGFGIQQLEYNAATQEQAADQILQQNTVEPRQLVTGQLILRNCCDMYAGGNDTIRLEVTTDAATSVFEFDRLAPGRQRPVRTAIGPHVASAPVAVAPESESVQPPPVSPPSPAAPAVVAVPPPTSDANPRPTAVSTAARPTPGGSSQDGFNAERLAKAEACTAAPQAVLTAKGPGFESYSVSCANGDALAIRCEMGNCRVLR